MTLADACRSNRSNTTGHTSPVPTDASTIHKDWERNEHPERDDLKELFVTATARKLGLGKVLMRHVACLAIERGYSRVDWITTKDNTAARTFYDRLGAVMNTEKVFYRLDGAALKALSSHPPEGVAD